MNRDDVAESTRDAKRHLDLYVCRLAMGDIGRCISHNDCASCHKDWLKDEWPTTTERRD